MDKRILILMAVALAGSASLAIYRKIYYKHDGVHSAITPRDKVLHVNDSITYRDNTAGADRWVWNFGDGEFSADQSGRHTFIIPGHFTIRLSVSGPFGTLKDSSATIDVMGSAPEAPASVAIDGPEGIKTGEAAHYECKTAAASYDWKVEDDASMSGNQQKGKMATYKFSNPGLKTLVVTMHSPDQVLRKQIMVQDVEKPAPVMAAAPAMPMMGAARPPKPQPHAAGARPQTASHGNSNLPDLGDGVEIKKDKKTLPEE